MNRYRPLYAYSMDSENPTNSVSVKVRVVFNQTLINYISVVGKTVGRAQLQQTCITVRKRLGLHNIFTTSSDYVCGYVVIDLWYKVPPESVFCAKKRCLDKYIQPRLKALNELSCTSQVCGQDQNRFERNACTWPDQCCIKLVDHLAVNQVV